MLKLEWWDGNVNRIVFNVIGPCSSEVSDTYLKTELPLV